MAVGFIIFLFLFAVGVITVYSWASLKSSRMVDRIRGRKVTEFTPGRFALLLKALQREGFFDTYPGQSEPKVVVNDFLSTVISNMATTDAFFHEVLRHELNVRNHPDPHQPYRFLLCSDYAVIGFNQGRTPNTR